MHVIYASVKKISACKIKLLLLIICFTGSAFTGDITLAAEPTEAQSRTNDIRVLIDVSGSMKKNDPKNLRLPALRLLVGLLPSDTSAAVWNFGTKAELIAAHGLADEKWKKNAHQASTKIHSRDLFTHIGAALEAAIADWGITPSKLNQRSIILLTDGMIDISKDKSVNTRERTRILEQLLPRIQQTGASIHTIALSKHADHEFLQLLSSQTDGAYEQTESAEQLERIFLRLFEKTTQPDTIPLINNQFLVDESIMELTLLVFKPQNAQPTEVIESDKTQYQKNNSPAYVKWQSEKNYDLITITRPKVGEWSINAQTDPDNRVLVVTNLQIQTNRMPNNLFIGELLNVSLFMTDNNNIINDDNFLQFISLSARQTEPNKKRWFLHDNGLRGDKEAHDGIFNVQIKKTLEAGKNQFTFQASTETLQRQINYSVMVHVAQLINTRAEQLQKDNINYHQILVTPNIEFVNPDSMTMSALLIEGDIEENKDSARAITLQQLNPKVLEWSYESDTLDPDKNHYVMIHMLTKTRTGRAIDYTSEPIALNLPKFDNLLLSPEQLLTDEALPDENNADTIAETIEESPAPEAEEFDWVMSAAIAVIANIIFAIAGWFAYRKWKNGREAAYEEITGELE